MISILFFTVFTIAIFGFGALFGAYTLAWTSVLWWVLSVGLAFLLSMLLLVLSMFVMGRLKKNANYDDQGMHAYVVGVMRLLTRLLRLKVVVSGKENIPDYPVILTGNHQTYYEILVIKPLLDHLPLVYIGKEVLFKLPIAAPVIEKSGNVPIAKLADRSAVKAILTGVKRYEAGHPVVIFPEGRRSHGQSMIDFKAGAFKLAMRPKAPILPFTIYNFINVWKGWPFKSQKVYIHFHKVIQPSEYEAMNTQALSDHVRAIIEEKLSDFINTHS